MMIAVKIVIHNNVLRKTAIASEIPKQIQLSRKSSAYGNNLNFSHFFANK